MNLVCKNIDKLIEIRDEARQNKDWILSDEIRTYLDSKHVFIIDTQEGQKIYHRKNKTRNGLIKELKQESRATKLFDAWLFSMNNKMNQLKFSGIIILIFQTL